MRATFRATLQLFSLAALLTSGAATVRGQSALDGFDPNAGAGGEQSISPETPFFDAAIETADSFYGLGAASYIDSYNSNNGPYDSTVKDDPSSPYYDDSRHGNINVGSATATVKVRSVLPVELARHPAQTRSQASAVTVSRSFSGAETETMIRRGFLVSVCD